MTAPSPASITSFPRAHEFNPVTFAIGRDRVDGYLAAVGDASDYGDSVPPLAAVALALDALQAEVSLPEGSLHTGQEVEHTGALLVGEPLTMNAWVAQRSERQGFVIMVLGFEISSSDGVGVQARTTIMAPAASA
jgi:hypothetical protein